MNGWSRAGHVSRRYMVHIQRCTTQIQQYTTQAPRAVRGMADRIGLAEYKHQHILKIAQSTATQYGYTPIHTPIVEYSSIFERTLGTNSDVVGKEMYKFLDSSNSWMTLRPEGTASVARAIITNKLEHSMPQRLFYSEPMFRHERPQRGRQRQFEQFGVELVGVAHPAADVECVQLGWDFLRALQVPGQLVLHINTLGDPESRSAYRKALAQYFGQHRNELSDDSQRRLDTNPLRILDSKHESDLRITAAAPAYTSYLTPASRAHFAFVTNALHKLGIPFTVNPRLVRGLDYYQHTVWEVACVSDELGRSQATVLAGGRYDGLTSMLGGSRQLPGVGWASGIERLALVMSDSCVPVPEPPVPVLIIPDRSARETTPDQPLHGTSPDRPSREVKPDVYTYAMRVARDIRKFRSACVVHGTSDSATNHQPLSKQLATVLARQPTPTHVVIVGSHEMELNRVIVRDTLAQTQHEISIDDLGQAL
ncbi:hypothetical protein GGH12_003946 [Coemansia sp. RSA 1822]|nr:hypothetical protein GGF49_002877 [Coemansia sp. RSA 1853]KAJ2561477.1 hypothetical protein GGH12_003946 [Coemansia sp. RSA 1822]